MPQKNWYQIKALANGNAEIFIYDEIGFWGITAKDFANELKAIDAKGSIELHLNSPGGSVTDGIAIYNLLKNHKATVNVVIDGLAASMASVIAMAGDTITMPENALMMIHNPWGGAMGDAEELRKTADVLDKMKKALISAYVDKTGLDGDEIDALMNNETWMTGSEAVEKGFATQVTDEVQLAASFDLDKLNQFKANVRSNFTTKEVSQPANQTEPNFNHSATAEQPQEEISMPNATKDKAAPVADTVDVEAIQAKAIADHKAQQKQRKDGINTVFANFKDKHGDLLAQCLADDDCTKEQASAKLLDALGKESEPQQGGQNVTAYAGNGNIVKESMVAAVKARAGMQLADGELDKSNPYKGMTLSEMARASLRDNGIGVASYDNRLSLVGAAFTHSTSDFGQILADTANKSMLKGYEEAPETFDRWTQRGTLSDFKVNKRVDLNSFPNLKKLDEGAEYQHATLGERGESIMLATYGRMFSITRQLVINDDLNALTAIPRKMGRAARRTIGNLVYAQLTSNPAMSDGTALFHADHKNLATGAGSALGIDALKAARKNFRLQKDAEGNLISVSPSFLIVPAALETDAEIYMNDTVYPGKSNNQRNPVANMAEVIVEPRLDDASSTAWYLAAGSMFDTIEVAYLDGNDTPFMDQQDGWNVDGTSFKVRIDAGVAPLDFRTLYKANGA